MVQRGERFVVEPALVPRRPRRVADLAVRERKDLIVAAAVEMNVVIAGIPIAL